MSASGGAVVPRPASHEQTASAEPSSRARILLGTGVVLIPLLIHPTARAQTGDGLETARNLHPHAAINTTYDSNLTRNPDGLGDHSDRYLTLEAGVNSDFTLGRQQFFIDGRIFHNTYDRYSELDHTGGDAKALWNWSLGRLWEGEISYGYDRKLRDLANVLLPLNDMLDRHKVKGSVNRWLTTRWRLGAQMDWTDLSASESAFLDKRVTGYGANLDYVSKAKNVISLRLTEAETDFAIADERNYDELSLGPAVDWRLTSKTRVTADAGYKRRHHDQLDERDFEGLVGRLAATWQASGKTSLKASIWHDLSTLDDEIANYAIVDGISLEPTWKVAEKTRLRARASYEERDFQGAQDNEIELDPSDRLDRVSAIEVGVDWEPRRNLSLSLSLEAESRDSNRVLREYDDQTIQLGVRVAL